MNTMNYINEIDSNCRVKRFDNCNDKISDYDIIHIFNPGCFPVESDALAKYAKQLGLKVVITPIMYETTDNATRRDGVIFGLAYKIIRNYRKAFKISFIKKIDPLRYLQDLFSEADLVLPNSKEEANAIIEMYDVLKEKVKIIPNGVDISFKNGDPKLFEKKYAIKDYILYVGRIEPQKNTYSLIKSFNNSCLDTHLVIIGNPTDERYYLKCKELSNDRVLFIPPIPHNSDLLRSAYKAAKVVALPSLYETAGLSALEGGLAGANIVITGRGGTKSYFQDYAFYIDPTNEYDITNGLIEAYRASKSLVLSEFIEKNFCWNDTAQKTVDLYRVLKSGK